MIPVLIKGSQFADRRGELKFFDIFDMQEVVLFHEIIPNSTQTIRAWQGHKKTQ